MDKNEHLKLTNTTAASIRKLLDQRRTIRINASIAFEPDSLGALPDDVRNERMQDAAVNRAIIQELSDIIETIGIMYPAT